MPTLSELYGAYAYNGDPLADDMGGQSGEGPDWRSHVPVEFEEIWASFSPEIRMAIAVVCQVASIKEEWS